MSENYIQKMYEEKEAARQAQREERLERAAEYLLSRLRKGETDDDYDILDPNMMDVKKFGFGYGSDLILIDDKTIEALMSGKLVAYSDGEYNHYMGWTCPKCGRVYSPSVEECWRCNDDV